MPGFALHTVCPSQSCAVVAIFVPILPVRKLKPGAVKLLAPGHSVGNRPLKRVAHYTASQSPVWPASTHRTVIPCSPAPVPLLSSYRTCQPQGLCLYCSLPGVLFLWLALCPHSLGISGNVASSETFPDHAPSPTSRHRLAPPCSSEYNGEH